MTIARVFREANGSISVRYPAMNTSPGTLEHEMTVEERLDHGGIPEGATLLGDVPLENAFPGWDFIAAWDYTPSGIVINMPKARDIHMASIREARNAKLAESDVEMTRALEDANSSEQARLKAKRQALRDLPASPSLDAQMRAANTPEKLKVVWPTELE